MPLNVSRFTPELVGHGILTSALSIPTLDDYITGRGFREVRLKVNSKEFIAACSNGEVYGKVVGAGLPFVFAELGVEVEYIGRRRDNAKTEYRKFLDCHAFFTDTQEKLNSEDYLRNVPEIDIIIFC